jgi:hypothetical protein
VVKIDDFDAGGIGYRIIVPHSLRIKGLFGVQGLFEEGANLTDERPTSNVQHPTSNVDVVSFDIHAINESGWEYCPGSTYASVFSK